MAYFLSPFGPTPQFFDNQANVLAGGKVYWYLAGTTTPEDTYTDNTGATANANPIILNSAGRPASGIFLEEGVSYKVRVFDASDNLIDDEDNIAGIATTATPSEWASSNLTATYISATQFSVPGDQTTDLHKRRRLKIVDAGGTKYATITASAYTTLTTVTVEVDAGGSLQTPITTLSWSLATATNPSIDADMVHRKSSDAVASAATCDIWAIQGDYVHVTGSTGPITSLGTAPYAGAQRTIIFDSTPTITHNATSLVLPGAQNLVMAANDRIVVRADTTANMVVTSVERASGKALNRLPRGHLAGLVLANNGADATNDIDIAIGECRDKDDGYDLVLASALTKQLDVAWAVGTNQGMLATGAAVTDTTYHIFLIARPDTGVVDVAADTSATGANIATNTNAAYTKIRRIGSIIRASGAIVGFVQDGDAFRFKVPFLAYDSGTSPGTSAITATLTSYPVGVRVQAVVNVDNDMPSGGASRNFLVSDLSGTDTAPASGAASSAIGASQVTRYGAANVEVFTNTSAQVRVRGDQGGASDRFRLIGVGWDDRRGRD